MTALETRYYTRADLYQVPAHLSSEVDFAATEGLPTFYEGTYENGEITDLRKIALQRVQRVPPPYSLLRSSKASSRRYFAPGTGPGQPLGRELHYSETEGEERFFVATPGEDGWALELFERTTPLRQRLVRERGRVTQVVETAQGEERIWEVAEDGSAALQLAPGGTVPESTTITGTAQQQVVVPAPAESRGRSESRAPARWSRMTVGVVAAAVVLILLSVGWAWFRTRAPTPVQPDQVAILDDTNLLTYPAATYQPYDPEVALLAADAGVEDAGAENDAAVGVEAPEDEERARRLCEGGNRGACHTAASLAEQAGELEIAQRYYRLGCEAGNTRLCSRAGALAIRLGAGEGRALLERGCDAGDARSCRELARLEWAEGDSPELRRHLGTACDGRVADACDRLGILVSRYGDSSEAAALFRQACDYGSAAGCANLAYHLMNGRGVPREEGDAVAMYQRACEGGIASACRSEVFVRRTRPALLDQTRISAARVRGCELGELSLCGHE